VPYAVLRGPHGERIREAGELVDALLQKEKTPA